MRIAPIKRCSCPGRTADVAVNHYGSSFSGSWSFGLCPACEPVFRARTERSNAAEPNDPEGPGFAHCDGGFDYYLPVVAFECGSEGSIALEIAFATLAGTHSWSTHHVPRLTASDSGVESR